MKVHGDSKSIARPALVVMLIWSASCQSVEDTDDPRQWSAPEEIEMSVASTGPAEIAMDSEGNVVATWAQTDRETGFQNASDDIWVNRREAGGSWGMPARVEQNEQGESFRPRIGIDGDGRVLIVFLQEDENTGRFSVWASRDTSTGEWEAGCIQLSASGSDCSDLSGRGDAGRPELAVDRQGEAVAVWHEVAGDGSVSIWSNRYVQVSGWGSAKTIEMDSNDLLNPHVAIAPSGTAIAVWERLDAATGLSSIFSKRQALSGGWESLQAIESKDTGNAFNPRAIADTTGNATAVWEQESPDGSISIWSNRYVAATETWGLAEPIEAMEDGVSKGPRVAVDGEGNVIAVWSRASDEHVGIWSNRYVVGSGWQRATPIGPTGLGSARQPDVAANPEGNAVAIWAQFNGVRERIWSNGYTAGRAWGRSGPLGTELDYLRHPRVAWDAEATAVAVWSQQPAGRNVFDIVSSRFESRPAPSD